MISTNEWNKLSETERNDLWFQLSEKERAALDTNRYLRELGKPQVKRAADGSSQALPPVKYDGKYEDLRRFWGTARTLMIVVGVLVLASGFLGLFFGGGIIGFGNIVFGAFLCVIARPTEQTICALLSGAETIERINSARSR